MLIISVLIGEHSFLIRDWFWLYYARLIIFFITIVPFLAKIYIHSSDSPFRPASCSEMHTEKHEPLLCALLALPHWSFFTLAELIIKRNILSAFKNFKTSFAREVKSRSRIWRRKRQATIYHPTIIGLES